MKKYCFLPTGNEVWLNVAIELYKNKINLQKHLVEIGLAKIYKKYAHQCEWSKNYLNKKNND